YMRAARARTGALVFSSLRELITLERVAKTSKPTKYISIRYPAPSDLKLPKDHDPEAWAVFREVANAVHWFATQIRDLEPAIVYRGAIPQDAKLLRPHLRQVRNFIVALTEIDTSVNRGWVDKQTILNAAHARERSN